MKCDTLWYRLMKGLIVRMIFEKKFLEEVSELIIEMDKKGYKKHKKSKKWYNRYADNKGRVILAKNDNGKVIGYLSYSYITKDCYDMLQNGLLTSDYALANSCYCKESKQILLTSIVVKKSQRNQGIAKALYEEFKKDIGNASYIAYFGDNLKESSFTVDLKRKGVQDSQNDLFYTIEQQI